jgi:hypothetical protein
MFLSTLFSLPAEVPLTDVCLEQESQTLVMKASQTSGVPPETIQLVRFIPFPVGTPNKLSMLVPFELPQHVQASPPDPIV